MSSEELRPVVTKAGLDLSQAELDDYSVFVSNLEKSIASLPDDREVLPIPDLKKYPRTNIHTPEDNDQGAWVTKFEAKSTSPTSDLLKGRTVALKDNIAFAEVKCTNGTSMVDWTPEIDATIATWIMDAGATIVGKAACENSCMEGMSATAVTGMVHNPYAHGYSAGGSSSGSGRLVATGAVDLAIGCDQGGSIRIPASSCGIVGHKPTWGLVPYTGILSLDAPLDHAGPMAPSARDAAVLLEAIAGRDGWDDRQPALGLTASHLNFVAALDRATAREPDHMLAGLRVGVLTEAFATPGADPAVAAAVTRAAGRFDQLGATVQRVSVPPHALAPRLWMCGLPLAGARAGLRGDAPGRRQLHLTDRAALLGAHERLTPAQFAALGPGAQNLWVSYLWVREKYGAALHGRCANLMKATSDAYDAALADYDVLVMPTLPNPPPRLPEAAAEGGGRADEGPLKFLSRTTGLLANTAPFNNSGHPAITIPVGFVPAREDPAVRLPVGMQIVGRKFADVDCLRAAAAWEKVFDWKTL
ncbi:amidase signature enzyme [Xylariomycetidae sp. FL0641]|nr:amidase signature enzyme [Xylariomycetidae sp. FL0641]